MAAIAANPSLVEDDVSNRPTCPYCNHDPLKHEIKDASLRVTCSDCLNGFCPGGGEQG